MTTASKKIYLFSLVDQTKFGGSSVYTAHLYRCLQSAGWEPLILRVGGKKTEKGSRPFTHGLQYFNVCIQDAVKLAKREKSWICYAHWKTHRVEAMALLELGLPITIHDPHDFYDEQFDLIRSSGSRIAAIRRTNARMMAGRAPVKFIPHPYVRVATGRKDIRYNAACLASIYYRKRQHIVAAANEILPEDKRAHFWGTLNRQYAYSKLDPECPKWRATYHGTLDTAPHASVRLFERSNYAIDLTVMGHDDGDGSQYAFLEAWDAGTPLIVHKKWILTGQDEIRNNETAIAIDTPQELAFNLLREKGREELVQNGREQLKQHEWESVVPLYEEML